MTEPITTVEAAVAELGALPVPCGPQPLDDARLAEIRNLLRYETSISFHSARAKESMLLLLHEVEQWRATYGADALPAALKKLREADEQLALPSTTEFAVRLPSGDVLRAGDPTSRHDQEARLARYVGDFPAARLVQRTVHYGDWTEADQ
jgi:hypothetical protein